MQVPKIYFVLLNIGYDPEVTSYEDAAFGQGLDTFSEPKARTFTFGLNVKF